MKMVADARDYSQDHSSAGLVVLALSFMPLLVIPIYILASPHEPLSGAAPTAFVFALSGLAFMGFFGMYLKSNGLLFKVPLRVFEEGLLIQPTLGMGPKRLTYGQITAAELWLGKSGGGCMVLTRGGAAIRSVENFRDRDAMKAFAGCIRPTLEAAGLRLAHNDDGEQSLRMAFRRSIVPGGRHRLSAAERAWQPI
ncbi:MAG: hypothetical protein AB1529_02395 [Candidatus Micrarchaeota archaeon]